MRRDLQEDLAFSEGLCDQVELEGLEVSQAAVDELARAARRARRPIALLDQCHAQPASGCVESGSSSRDAAADDRDVEHLVAHAPQGLRAVFGAEAGGVHGFSGLNRARRILA